MYFPCRDLYLQLDREDLYFNYSLKIILFNYWIRSEEQIFGYFMGLYPIIFEITEGMLLTCLFHFIFCFSIIDPLIFIFILVF